MLLYSCIILLYFHGKRKKERKVSGSRSGTIRRRTSCFVLVPIAIMRPFYTRRSQAIKIDIVNQSI